MRPAVIDVAKTEDLRDVVHRAVQALAEGRVVGVPTETVYGLAVSACVPLAVERLAAVKGRRPGAPFTVAIKSASEALDYAPHAGPLAQRLARRCWPGPITLVLDTNPETGLVGQLPPDAQRLIAPEGTVGLRVPASNILLDVLRMIAGPVALTSANMSGGADSTTAQQLLSAVGDNIDLVLDDGPARYGQSSTVVRVNGNTHQVLRPGVVSEETLDQLARVLVVFVCTGNTCRSPMAAALFQSRLAQRMGCNVEELETRGVTVASAGLHASVGAPASPEGVELMKQRGLDLAKHEAQLLTDRLVRHADLLVTMTRGHRSAIVEGWPEAAARTQTLLGEGQDLADPIGGPAEVYRRCAEQIDAALEPHVAAALVAAGVSGTASSVGRGDP